MATVNQKLPATILVIFGITGDLAGRYLLPALAQIKVDGQAGPGFRIIGVTRRDVTAEQILDTQDQSLVGCLSVFKLDYNQPDDYRGLAEEIEAVKGQLDANAQVVFHLSVPPDVVPVVVSHLGVAGLNRGSKLLMEKPFGRDLASAKELISQVSKCFDDNQVYRIDHYLAKEMAQNIALLLGSNAVFREAWSAKYIDRIEIVAKEAIGIEGRVGFYEQTGALRDFVQSHLLQLLALTLMEPCEDFADLEALPGRRLAALRQLKADSSKAVRGQYEGYRQEIGKNDSNVETFAWLELSSDSPTWHGVPLVLATGKKLDAKLTEIRVYFKPVGASQGNTLVLQIYPKEGVEFDLWVKEPGLERKMKKMPLNFYYQDHFDRLPDAYEQVLVDAMRGDHSLFASAEEVTASWEILEPVLEHWQQNGNGLKIYQPGSPIDKILD